MPVEIIDEDGFYRIDGMHILDKHKIEEIREYDGKFVIHMKDKNDVLIMWYYRIRNQGSSDFLRIDSSARGMERERVPRDTTGEICISLYILCCKKWQVNLLYKNGKECKR